MGRTWRHRRHQRQRTSRNQSLSSETNFVFLIKWLTKFGWSMKCPLQPTLFPDSGRGLMATKSVKTGDLLVSIPAALLVTTATVATSEIGKVFRKSGNVYFAQQILATFLVWEQHLNRSSKWKNYIATLPRYFSTPHILRRSFTIELPEYLKDMLESCQNSMKETYGTLLHSLGSLKCVHCNTMAKDIITWEIYAWAWCCVNTRAVYIEPHLVPAHDLAVKDRNCLALAPYLDMFNHSYTASVKVGLSPERNCYEIFSLEPCKKFNEVFINYGPHSNIKLYLEYGFILPSNPHDFIPITYNAIKSAISSANCKINFEEEKLSFLSRHNFLSELTLSVLGLSWNAIVIVCVLLCDSRDSKEWSSIAFCKNSYQNEITYVAKFRKAACELIITEKRRLEKSLIFIKQIMELRGSSLSENSFEFTSETNTLEICILLHNELLSVIDAAASNINL